MTTDFLIMDKRNLALLIQLQKLPLEQKIKHSVEEVKKALIIAKNPMVACSFGKDSMVMLHIIKQIAPDIKVRYGNTGIEYPENLKFKSRIVKEWNLNFYQTKPVKSFWDIVRELGWPLMGKTFRKSMSPKVEQILKELKISSSCCYYLKEKPAIDLQKKLGADLEFVGSLASESKIRRMRWVTHGELYWAKSPKTYKCLPIAIWNEKDIWDYHKLFDIPINPLYILGHHRNGCWACGMDIMFSDNHLSKLRRTHPHLYKKLIVDKGLGEVLLKLGDLCGSRKIDSYYYGSTIEQIIESEPCFFDTLISMAINSN